MLSLLQRYVPLRFWSAISYQNQTLELLGLAILVVSSLFTLWARWNLGTMWSATPSIKERHELRTNGPYRLTRHPIYTGILGMLFGTVLYSGFGMMLVVFALFCVYLGFKIPAEERLLTETFGERYRQYQRRVPALIPIPGR